MTNDAAHLHGGCQCGACRYEVRGAPKRVYCCHCRECQLQSSSAFGISVIVEAADFRMVEGQPKTFSRPATVSGSLSCAFCPDCGTRLYHGDPAAESEISIKGGTLDHPPDLSDAWHIWTQSRLTGVALPAGAVCYLQEPDD